MHVAQQKINIFNEYPMFILTKPPILNRTLTNQRNPLDTVNNTWLSNQSLPLKLPGSFSILPEEICLLHKDSTYTKHLKNTLSANVLSSQRNYLIKRQHVYAYVSANCHLHKHW